MSTAKSSLVIPVVPRNEQGSGKGAKVQVQRRDPAPAVFQRTKVGVPVPVLSEPAPAR